MRQFSDGDSISPVVEDCNHGETFSQMSDGGNVWATAAKSRDLRQVTQSIADGSLDVNETVANSEWNTPLQIAANAGNFALVELLLNAGARMDELNNDGRTACHAAAFAGAADVMALLRDRGADLTRCDEHHLSPLGVAVYSDWEILAIELIESGVPLDNADMLCEAATLSIFLIQVLIDRQIDVKMLRDAFGRSPVHFAVRRRNNLPVIKYLVVDVGVDVHAVDKGGTSTFHDCAYYGTKEYLRFLLDAGGAAVDVNRQDNFGRTTLHHACANLQTDNVIFLLAMGADVHARDEWGQTACLVMSTTANRELLSVLLAAGSDFDAADDDQHTVRQNCARIGVEEPTGAEIDEAHQRLESARLDCVRMRAFQVCVGLHALELDALQMCEILVHACGPAAPLIAFHRWWKIATTAKHFKCN
jgi:ankyrin repeat protein